MKGIGKEDKKIRVVVLLNEQLKILIIILFPFTGYVFR